MVLRSGIIIPFQFRDNKKLLTIGVPEEERDLNIWDLKNVVRSAFGIYNFEFRNKKIGFNIPDELLLNYLAQRHDLTNFVIEVVQAFDDVTQEEARESVKDVSLCELSSSKARNAQPLPSPTRINNNLNDVHPNNTISQQRSFQEYDSKNTSLKHDKTNHEGSPDKLHISQVFGGYRTPESLTHSIDPMDILPKSEQDINRCANESSCSNAQLQYYSNYGREQNYLSRNSSLFRRRGERMSRDQKELYVKYFEENPCMLTQRRNDIVLGPHWQKLCSKLNSIPQGAIKNIEEWKQTFDAWRYRVFMYTRYNSKLTGDAATNPKNYKPLTPTDQRAYAIWTSHKSHAPQDFEKMDVFAQLEESNADFDYCQSKFTYELSTNSCISCRCLPLQKSTDDNTAKPVNENQHSNQRRLRHSSSSNNDSPVAEPAYKVRRQTQNSSELTVQNFADPAQSDGEIAAETEFSHLQMEHKFDYDSASNEDEAANSIPSASGFQNDTSISPKVSFERIQIHHDYYMQQQQQQQQQQQLQHHMEMLMQERTSSGITLRQRKERMSRKQKEVYVNFLEQTPVMSEYKRNDPFLDVYWQKLTDILNSVPQGAIKTVNEWKQAFDNWRFRIYLYARYNSKITGDDVLNSKNFKPLTMTDKRAYALWIRNADTAPPDLDKMRNIFVNIDEAPPE